MRQLLAGEARLLAKYERSLLESYVEDNAMTRWCPRCAPTLLTRACAHVLCCTRVPKPNPRCLA